MFKQAGVLEQHEADDRDFRGGRDHDHRELSVQYISGPNRWSQIRHYIREPAAEFFGTMIFLLFGNGVNCQVVLSGNQGVAHSPKGDWLSISFGWAVGAALGIWTCGGISGGHINPSVTLSMAIFRGFPWKKVPIYWTAQILGAFCGAGLVYANYFHAIDIFEGGVGVRTVPGTAALFGSYALDYMTSASCFFDEFILTAILLMVVLAVTDKQNMAPTSGMLPVAVFVLVLGIGACFGMQTGYASNPARDLGPRLMTAMAGYGKDVFTYRNQYWLWCPIIATLLGGIAGSFIYDTFIFAGPESIMNRPTYSVHACDDKVRNTSTRVTLPSGGDVV